MPFLPPNQQRQSTEGQYQYQKGKIRLDLNAARGDGVLMQWQQLDQYANNLHLLQTDNHTNTSSLNYYRPHALPDAIVMQSENCTVH